MVARAMGKASKVRVGLAALVAAATLVGVMATAPQSVDAVQCYDSYVGAPINEGGIECPGNPAIWKSYTFASNGFGYYTETEQLGSGRSEVRMGYKHRDGRVALSRLDCNASGCEVGYWNGVPFPFSGRN